MSSPLKQNTTTIQELLDKINSLPEAGYDGVELPELTNEGSTEDLMLGKELIDANGNVVSGSFTIDSELTAQDNLIAQISAALEGKAAGSEPALQSKTVSPSTSSQTVKPDSGYDGLSQVTVNAMTTATQATPSISVNSSGLITASATQTAGYVVAGTKSATKQLTTQAAKTITPSTSSQTAVAKDVYTTGAVTVAAIPSNYIIPSGTINITTNGTFDVANYVSATVSVAGGSGSNEVYTRLVEEGILSDSEMTEVSNNFCRGWYHINKVNLPIATKIGTYVWYNCVNLTEANIPCCTELGTYSFYNCSNLTSVNCPNITSIGGSVFRGCSLLTSLTFLEATSIGTYGLRACTALVRLDFSKLSSIGNNAFLESSSLATVIIRTSSVCTLSNKNAFTSTPIESGTGYIYVPATLVDSYKTATNWSAYANQIRAIEDYPEICG